VPALGHVFPAYSSPGGTLIDYMPLSAGYDELSFVDKSSVHPDTSLHFSLQDFGGGSDCGAWSGYGGCYGGGQVVGYAQYMQEPYMLGVQSW